MSSRSSGIGIGGGELEDYTMELIQRKCLHNLSVLLLLLLLTKYSLGEDWTLLSILIFILRSLSMCDRH
jgi:hypothetical protein